MWIRLMKPILIGRYAKVSAHSRSTLEAELDNAAERRSDLGTSRRADPLAVCDGARRTMAFQATPETFDGATRSPVLVNLAGI